ncbi:MAG: hypothetical protein WA775_11090 [Psychroserpens sp.]|uniref:hypothetical protein n=1 Tax=Psychroserpens sp. TaxID=2020870 RepID=UPI003C775353
MSIRDNPAFKNLIYKKTVELGDLYFFEKMVVSELHEGVHVNFENFSEARIEIEHFYGQRHFGFIANRIQPYSITLTDANLYNDIFKNLRAYATVTYTELASKVVEVENYFFKFNKRNFKDLDEAIDWVQEELQKKTAY